MLDEALQIDQLNFRILYDQAFFLVSDGKFEFAKYKLANVQYYIGNKKIDDIIFNFNTIFLAIGRDFFRDDYCGNSVENYAISTKLLTKAGTI